MFKNTALVILSISIIYLINAILKKGENIKLINSFSEFILTLILVAEVVYKTPGSGKEKKELVIDVLLEITGKNIISKEEIEKIIDFYVEFLNNNDWRF